MRQRLSIHRGYIILLVFSVLLFFSGCNAMSDELKALESSVSTIHLTTGREISRWHQDKGVTLGKPVHAKVRIEYQPTNNFTQEDVYNEIVTILDKRNWERETQSIVQFGYMRATLPQDGFSIVAEVQINSDSNIVSIDLTTIPR